MAERGAYIDWLGAVADYVEARNAESQAHDEHTSAGEYTWDYWGASYIEAVEDAEKKAWDAWQALITESATADDSHA